jgi:hypothetical protein
MGYPNNVLKEQYFILCENLKKKNGETENNRI